MHIILDMPGAECRRNQASFGEMTPIMSDSPWKHQAHTKSTITAPPASKKALEAGGKRGTGENIRSIKYEIMGEQGIEREREMSV